MELPVDIKSKLRNLLQTTDEKQQQSLPACYVQGLNDASCLPACQVTGKGVLALFSAS